MKKQRMNKNILYMTQMGILLAVIILMAFTPIGYIKTAGLEITLITIPVIVGAIVLGPKAGMVLGAAFGVTSFLQAALGLSAFGAVLMGISPILCFIVCVPTRLLMGLFTGLIFKAFKKRSFAAYSLTGLCGALLNTLLFMSTLLVCFWNTEFIQGLASSMSATGVLAFTVAFVGVNGVVEAISCFVVAAAVSSAVNKYVNGVV